MTEQGLEGVVVADTLLSQVDGERGRLVLRGYDVRDLAGRVAFDELCALLWAGKLPIPSERGALREAWGRARVEAFDRIPTLGAALRVPNAMDALRASMAQLSLDEPSPLDPRLRICAAMAVFASAWSRLSRGESLLPPDPNLPPTVDYLRMLTAGEPEPARVEALDTYLVAVADHGMNASTFTARIVASTDSDPVSAVVAALAAFKGPLHGGAPGPVLDMLDAVGSPEHAPAWIAGELDAGRRIMGMGHRVYRVRDPRAQVFEDALERLRRSATLAQDRLPLARALEKAAETALQERHPERRLAANVEFYTAVLLDAIGLPRDLFTATFATSRVAGWLAHFDEQRATGRLIRPRSRYVGPPPEARSSES